MAKYKYGLAIGGLFIWEADNPEPPSCSKKILRVENQDYKVAAFVVRALNARYKWESSLEQKDVKQGDANTASPK